MRRIDQHIDVFALQIIGEARGTAEAAASHRHRLARRRDGPPGERERQVETGAAGQPLRQQARLGRAAKNKDARHAAA
jgi:hypothetical protein